MTEAPRSEELENVDPRAPQAFTGAGSNQGVVVNLGQGSSFTFSNNKFEATRLTMASLAATLERFLDRPVVDMTDLKGSYNFSIDVTAEDYRAMLIRSAVPNADRKLMNYSDRIAMIGATDAARRADGMLARSATQMALATPTMYTSGSTPPRE